MDFQTAENAAKKDYNWLVGYVVAHPKTTMFVFVATHIARFFVG